MFAAAADAVGVGNRRGGGWLGNNHERGGIISRFLLVSNHVPCYAMDRFHFFSPPSSEAAHLVAPF